MLAVRQGLSQLDLHTSIYYVKKPQENREPSSVKSIPLEILMTIKFYHSILRKIRT